jgi:hypothetical protein
MNEAKLPLYSPENVDLKIFNAIKSPDHRNGKPVKDMRRFFYKQIIIDDEIIISTEPIKVPGYIGIANSDTVPNHNGNPVSGHDDIVKFLDEYGLLICTYVYNKDVYGQFLDLRWSLGENEQGDLMEMVIKGGGHHAGAIVPAMREKKSYASLNEPDTYHDGLFGHAGFVAVGQRLVFPEFVTQEQARGYSNSIICWLALMNSFVEFSENDFNGGDPIQVYDRPSLKEFLKNCALAALGSTDAIDYLNEPQNRTYCAEFIYIGLNTPIYPFNKQGLSLLLDGDEAKATEILKLQDRQNNRKVNLLSKTSNNPEFKYFNIQMPLVPEDLPPLDVLMAQHGQSIDAQSIPFPPFTLSQVVRRAVKTLLPREAYLNDALIAQAQANLFASLEPLIFKQLGITLPPAPPVDIPGVPPAEYPMQPQPEVQPDPRVAGVREFMTFVINQLQQPYNSYESFNAGVDEIMLKADEFLGATNVKYFVPPRIYIDLGQNDGDKNLPQGWGFSLETIGALIYRGAIRETLPQPDNITVAPEDDDSKHPFKTAAFCW